MLDSLNSILLTKLGFVCSLQSGLILGTASMGKYWFKHQLRIAVEKVDVCAELLTDGVVG